MENTNNNAQTAPVGQKKSVEITITMPTHAYFLSGIRDFTLNLIKNMTEFSEKWAYRFQSIVDELCNNAIEHGSKEGEMIKIIFKTEPNDFIQISVEDTGTAIPHLTALQIEKIVDERRQQTGIQNLIRGRGLPKIVYEWTEELKFQDTEKGGILVTVKKFLNDPSLSQTESSLDQPNKIVLN